MIPSPFAFVLLALAVFRVWRLLAEDTILDGPRAWLLGVPGWKPTGHETPPDGYRTKLATFLTCPHCAGFWISVSAWGLWLLTPWWTVTLAVPLAISAVVGVLGSRLG